MMESTVEVNATVSRARKSQAINDALGQWDLARIAFSTALQTYLDTFSHFEFVCSQLFGSKEHDVARPDVRAAIDDEALSLALHESSIISTRRKLLQLRNLSRSASPIAALPAEVLSRIFVFTIELCRAGDAALPCPALWVRQVNTISSVCSHWRSTALSTRRLWTCIDFKQLDHTKHLDLWLDRARSYPLNIAQVTRSEHDEDGDSRFCLALPRMGCVRSMVLSSKIELMEQWILGWCTNGAPRVLTTLALSVPWEDVEVEFPPQGENVDRQRLTELLDSLDTLYLSGIQVNWYSMICRNLVTLSLHGLVISAEAFRHVLMANPNLQRIELMQLGVTNAPTSLALPTIQLRWLHTLRLKFYGSYEILGMITPGQCKLTLKLENSYTRNPSDPSIQDLAAFCRRSHITKLHCQSHHLLAHVLTAESKIEAIFFRDMVLDSSVYDLIVPLSNDDSGLPSEHIQLRLPHLHSLNVSGVRLRNPEGFRRILSICSIREVEMDNCCRTEGGHLNGVDDLKNWIGPGINASFVLKKRERGYSPFDG
ncbi:hypothetical protein BDV93DRAFT_526163 [Ceratobasidium sp. AG-I]|nr:hypothetical protein BDV93DRAFT_526163 [Ceratobasidium sp. AG-I]